MRCLENNTKCKVSGIELNITRFLRTVMSGRKDVIRRRKSSTPKITQIVSSLVHFSRKHTSLHLLYWLIYLLHLMNTFVSRGVLVRNDVSTQRMRIRIGFLPNSRRRGLEMFYKGGEEIWQESAKEDDSPPCLQVEGSYCDLPHLYI